MELVQASGKVVEEPALDAIDRLAQELKMQYCFFPAMDKTFGNAILWRECIFPGTTTGHETIHIASQENRSVGYVRFNDTFVFVTHLDHRLEETRMCQLESVFNFINKCTADVPGAHVILGGDLNALDLTDYEPETLDAIRQRRHGHWEEPRGNVISELKTQGWVDCWKTCNPTQRNPSTCEYQTRIDYIWTRQTNVGAVKSCAIIKDMRGSDHDAILCEFTFL